MAACAIGLGATALAAPAGAEELTGSVTAYGWVPWIDQTVTTSRGEAAASISGSDVLDSLDFTFMAAGQVRYGRFGAIADFIYGKFSTDSTLSGPLGSRVDIDNKTFLISGGLTYRLFDGETASLDAMAGARFVSMDVDVKIAGGGGAGITRSTSASESFVDPVIGIGGRMALTDELSLFGLANVGGFGVGSDLSWEVFAGVDYAFAERFSTQLGFRYISIDYSKDGRELDVDFYGPAIGLAMRF